MSMLYGTGDCMDNRQYRPTNEVGPVTRCWDSADFYRAMRYSAKRGIAIACRPSVCL